MRQHGGGDICTPESGIEALAFLSPQSAYRLTAFSASLRSVMDVSQWHISPLIKGKPKNIVKPLFITYFWSGNIFAVIDCWLLELGAAARCNCQGSFKFDR